MMLRSVLVVLRSLLARARCCSNSRDASRHRCRAHKAAGLRRRESESSGLLQARRHSSLCGAIYALDKCGGEISHLLKLSSYSKNIHRHTATTCNAPHSHIDSAAAAPQQPPWRQVPPPILCPHRACVPAEVGMGVVHAVQYPPGTRPRWPALEKRWGRDTVARSYAPVTPASGTCSSTCAAQWYAAWSVSACSARAPPQARARARSAALGALAFALRPLRLPTPPYAPHPLTPPCSP